MLLVHTTNCCVRVPQRCFYCCASVLAPPVLSFRSWSRSFCCCIVSFCHVSHPGETAACGCLKGAFYVVLRCSPLLSFPFALRRIYYVDVLFRFVTSPPRGTHDPPFSLLLFIIYLFICLFAFLLALSRRRFSGVVCWWERLHSILLALWARTDF